MRRALAIIVLSACAPTAGGAPGTDAAKPSTPPTIAGESAAIVSVPEDSSIAAEPPSAPAGPQTLAPVGTAPSWADVLALARSEGLVRPAKAASLVGLGADRWAAAVRTTDHTGGPGGDVWTMHVLVVDAGAPLRLVDRRALVSWEDLGVEDRPARAPVALFADDYDGDGRRELLVRFGFTLMLCGIGQVERRELRIYDHKDDALRPQIALTLDDRVYFGADTGRESFADRDADGRADLVVTVRSHHDDVDDVNEGRPLRSKGELVFAYIPAKDEYERAVAKPGKGRSPVDHRLWDPCEEGESPGSAAL